MADILGGIVSAGRAVAGAVPGAAGAVAVAGKTVAVYGTAVGAAYTQLAEQGAAEPINANITFPTDLIQNQRNFYISFRFEKYSKPSMKDSVPVKVEPLVGLKLPLPTELRDDKSVEYDNTSFGPFVGAVLDGMNADRVAKTINDLTSVNGITDKLSEAYKILENAAKDPATAATALRQNPMALGMGAEALQRNFPELAKNISSISGTAFNPYQAILFKTPNFRNHSFSWRLTPSNQIESEKIKAIIDVFQSNMLPGLDTKLGAVLFQYPSVVNVNLFPDDYYLYKFKKCVVESVSVNYAPHSSPAFYRSNAPAAVNLTVKLKEIELWTRRDYTGQPQSASVPIMNTPPT